VSHNPARPTITVQGLLTDPQLSVPLKLVAGGHGVQATIDHARIQKPGLALVGHYHGVVPTRVQILGETEISYLASLAPGLRAASLAGFFGLQLSLVVITALDRDVLSDLETIANEHDTPLVLSPERSSRTIAGLHLLLDERLAPREDIHGVTVDVFGVGVLLLGESGIGKSECALELVLRGHRLVADDVVHCEWRPPGVIFGSPAELLRDHIEVRGLGILNLRDLYGVTSTRSRKRIDIIIKLVEWREDMEYDRMGVEEHHRVILGVPIREVLLPLRSGRSITSIIEVAARNELMRASGVNSAQEFFARLDRTLLGTSGDNESDSLVPSPTDGWADSLKE
jgi:HPr kinase/phosphorylase